MMAAAQLSRHLIVEEPGMAADQVSLVQASFAQVRPLADAFARLFYTRLFELDPALRALFHTDMAEQRRKLIQMLDAIVEALDRPALIVAEVAALGQRHAGYGVLAKHYTTVEEALLWALAHELGERWTPEVAEAWRATYTLVAGTMQASASSLDLEVSTAIEPPVDQSASHIVPHRTASPQ
jgi:hemoglobin-like flavoprotein